ncbi:MAG: DUF3231 family protein [Desulfotomaculaceae bacterium]|nr:DUF3231 family protein [Desulfotomaculaceae bacterium]
MGNKTELVISSITGLWSTYMSDCASRCLIKHFSSHVDMKETQDILQYALNLSEQHIKEIEGIFNNENLPIPDAFGEDDVDINAPRLFTDAYYLFYLGTMVGFGMDAYSLIVRYTARPDIMDFFLTCINESSKLLRKVTLLRLEKGLFLNAPRVEVSKRTTYIEKETFLGGLLGEPRPLLAREVTNVFAGELFDIVWKATTTGFGQVTTSKQVKDFMFKGRDIASAHFKEFSKKLNDENIPVPSISDAFVTDSTVSPFSDKLMMFQALVLCALAIGVDGAAIATSMRSDLLTLHTKFGAEILKYASEGEQIMINNRWMEQPPQVVRHEELTAV